MNTGLIRPGTPRTARGWRANGLRLATTALLALALLAAQALGQWHRVAHGVATASSAAAHADCDARAHAYGHGHGHGHRHFHALNPADWYDGHDAGSDQCRLYDALGHADAVAPLALATVATPVAAAAGVATPVLPATRPQPRPYQARAPPA